MMDQRVRIDHMRDVFQRRYGGPPQVIARAPGRVELIGNHTDYNEGFVMPAAVDRDVLAAVSAVPDKRVAVYSVNFDSESSFSLEGTIERSEEAPWSNYVRGVIDQIRKHGSSVLPGLEIAVEGNVPLGGGLSSSAAIEVATGLAVLEAAGDTMSGPDLALLCQRAENEFVGVASGIMDQFISRLAQEGEAMFLDCRTLHYEFALLPEGTRIIVADTGEPRELAASEYNVRRGQCEEAVRKLKEVLPDITALRDVSIEELEEHATLLSDLILKRARHVVSENDRVLRSVAALRAGDAQAFGDLLNASHASSRDLYSNSSKELDWLQEAAMQVPGCMGSRLTGAGFGGCTVSIVREEAVEEFRNKVSREYAKRTGRAPQIDVMSAARGAERLA